MDHKRGTSRKSQFEQLRAYIDEELLIAMCEYELFRIEGAELNNEFIIAHVQLCRKLLNAADHIYKHRVKPPH